jgi:hypothetical protein
MTINGLTPGSTYYIAVRGQDTTNLGPIVTASATAKSAAPLGAGTYDDANSAWTYSGTWTTYAGAGPYNSTLHYNNTVGATASFKFHGTQFVLTYTAHPNRGSFEVWVDGAYVETVNANSASLAWQRTYTSPVFTSGVHTVEFKNVGPAGAYTDVDAIRIIAPVGAGMYDDANSAWTYSGAWSTYAGAGPYSNTLHYSNNLGASATFVFNGIQFVLTYTAHPNRGSFEVWVDGAYVETVNANSASLAWQRTYTSPVFTLGVHTVEFKNVGPAGAYTDVDAIQIIAPVSAGMYDDTHAGWTYGGAWTMYAGSGPYAGTLHYTSAVGATASFAFSGTQFVLTYTAYTNRGSFEVWVDGALVTTINAYNPSLVWQKAYVSPVYSAGNHTVLLKYIGPSGVTDIDAIRILP